MKWFGINSLRQLIRSIQGDMSQLTGSIVPTFQEVYENLQSLDEDKADKTDLPTNVSDLTNDSGFISFAAVSVKTYCALTGSYTDKPSYGQFVELEPTTGLVEAEGGTGEVEGETGEAEGETGQTIETESQIPNIYDIPFGYYLWIYFEIEFSDGTVYRNEPLCITDGLARTKISTLESTVETLQSAVDTLTQKVANLESMGYVGLE